MLFGLVRTPIRYVTPVKDHTTLYNKVNLLLRDVISVNLGFHMCSHCLSMLIPFSQAKKRQRHIGRIDLVRRTDPLPFNHARDIRGTFDRNILNTSETSQTVLSMI